ncbi:MAG: sugar phosphate isomerase/epimerase [Methylobacterium mesophilicum]|nr:sugar phosphate isomerase/epimerase [Methylobacterium mesophilicum]
MSTLGLDATLVSPDQDPGRLEREMDRLAEHGIGVLEIRLERPRGLDVRRLRGLADAARFELSAVCDLPALYDPQDSADDALAFLEGVFRDCADLNSPILCGMLYGVRGNRKAQGQRALDRATRFLERAAKAARVYDVRLAIEPANRYETRLFNRAEDAFRAVERIGSESLVIGLDTGQMHAEEKSFASGFETAAPFLASVRLAEASRGVPGNGMVDWTAVFASLDTIAFSGPVTLSAEARLDEVLEEGLPLLREKAGRFTFARS